MNTKKTYLLCIISCEKNKHTKLWIKKYWLNNLIINNENIDYLFIYGSKNIKNEYEINEDELLLKCDDGYFRLNEKMYKLWFYLLKYHYKSYDFYIKCDDDNYIHTRKYCKLLQDTEDINFFGIYNIKRPASIWNNMPTGKWKGPFYEGPLYWFSINVLKYYCSKVTNSDLIECRLEDKLFCDIVRDYYPVKVYNGDIALIGFPKYINYKHSQYSDINIDTYNSAILISNLKEEKDFIFFFNCYNNEITFNQTN